MRQVRLDRIKQRKADNGHDAPRKQPRDAPRVRFLDRADVLAITGVTFMTIWAWMRDGKFPRARLVGTGAKNIWLSTDIEAWSAGLPEAPLKPLASASKEIEPA
jgi:predicted DNA-binding transcriptional regulator AlpA